MKERKTNWVLIIILIIIFAALAYGGIILCNKGIIKFPFKKAEEVKEVEKPKKKTNTRTDEEDYVIYYKNKTADMQATSEDENYKVFEIESSLEGLEKGYIVYDIVNDFYLNVKLKETEEIIEFTNIDGTYYVFIGSIDDDTVLKTDIYRMNKTDRVIITSIKGSFEGIDKRKAQYKFIENAGTKEQVINYWYPEKVE